MYISLNWLRDFVKIPSKVTYEDIAWKLTMATCEIEGVETLGSNLKGIIAGKIESIISHPQADKLNIASINIGKKKSIQVLFQKDALPIEVGHIVPVAVAPTILPNGMKIEEREMRGELSQGMLCIDSEIGLAKDGLSMQFFGEEVKPGTPVAQALQLDDIVFEVDNKSLTHRPDLWGHYGVAREVASIFNTTLQPYVSKKCVVKKEHDLSVTIKDKKLCPRYLGVVIDNIKIEPSPVWLRARLLAAGVRPISNIVDVTNYVMLEIGQPLHAFDYNKLTKVKKTKGEVAHIVVRSAIKGEKLTTLDLKTHELTEDMLVIADDKEPIALAGVMGGASTAIDENTSCIIIESANFEPYSIRKTALTLGSRSESSARFEKSLDPEFANLAIKQVCALIQELLPEARISSDIVDVNNSKKEDIIITTSYDYIAKRIGEFIPSKDMEKILVSLGFIVKEIKNGIMVTVPSWRATKDISLPEDLVEEVARVYGYDNIKPVMPYVQIERPRINHLRQTERKTKEILVGLGFSEVYNYAFVDTKAIKALGGIEKDYLALENPIASNQTHMRANLLHGLLENVADNIRFYNTFSIFELGMVFAKEDGKWTESKDSKVMMPRQDVHCAGCVVSSDETKAFLEAKNTCVILCSTFGLDVDVVISKQVQNWTTKGVSADVLIDGNRIGEVCVINTSLKDIYDIEKQVAYFVIHMDALVKNTKDTKRYISLPKYPSIILDWSVIVPKNVMWQDMYDKISNIDPLIREIEVFDVYEGEHVDKGFKSVAFHVDYRSYDKTLTMEEVEIMHKKVLKVLEKEFSAKARV